MHGTIAFDKSTLRFKSQVHIFLGEGRVCIEVCEVRLPAVVDLQRPSAAGRVQFKSFVPQNPERLGGGEGGRRASRS